MGLSKVSAVPAYRPWTCLRLTTAIQVGCPALGLKSTGTRSRETMLPSFKGHVERALRILAQRGLGPEHKNQTWTQS